MTLGPEAEVFRGSINVPGRRRAVRHLVAISKKLALTRTSADLKARRTVLVSDDPRFVLYRIGIRFGLPVLCEWSDWFAAEIARRDAMRPLIGFGCRPVMISGTKRRFLGWMGHALKRQAIQPRPDIQRRLASNLSKPELRKPLVRVFHRCLLPSPRIAVRPSA